MAQVTLNIDSTRTVLIATGKVAAAHEWTDGKRSDAQKRDPNTGMPVWIVDCVLDDDSARSATAGVEVPSLDEPQVTKWRPVEVRGLRVAVYVNRSTSALGMRWSADEIAGGGAASRPHAVPAGA